MTRLAREKFPEGKVGDTVKVRVPDIDRGRCDSRNILRVIMEAEIQDRNQVWYPKFVVCKKPIQHMYRGYC